MVNFLSSQKRKSAVEVVQELGLEVAAVVRTGGHVRRKGADPLSGAEEQTARTFRAYALCACLLSLYFGSVN